MLRACRRFHNTDFDGTMYYLCWSAVYAAADQPPHLISPVASDLRAAYDAVRATS